jgi:DNA-binding PadR family transcriptional regulator
VTAKTEPGFPPVSTPRSGRVQHEGVRIWDGGSLYPALQKILLRGWVRAAWGVSETNRKVRFYKLTRDGLKQLEAELSDYERQTKAIRSVLRMA